MEVQVKSDSFWNSGEASDTVEPTPDLAASGDTAIGIELAQIWYNIRVKMDAYVRLFANQYSCSDLRLVLNRVYRQGIQDLTLVIKAIFNQLYLSVLNQYLANVCL